MNTQLLLSKIQMLPEYKQSETMDFIDYLLSKENKDIQKYSVTDEDETERSIEASAVHDSKEDYLTEKEVSYYLKLKDDSETR